MNASILGDQIWQIIRIGDQKKFSEGVYGNKVAEYYFYAPPHSRRHVFLEEDSCIWYLRMTNKRRVVAAYLAPRESDAMTTIYH